MREVSIVGIGQTRVGELWDRSLRSLAAEAVRAALEDAEIERADALYIGNMLSGEITGQEHLGPLVAQEAGLTGVPALKIEAACGAAGGALHVGVQAVASGFYQSVVVVGVEKMTDRANGFNTAALAQAADQDFEAAHGVSFVALNALLMRRYMHEHGYGHGDFAPFAITAHQNAASNPKAMFQRPISQEEFERARPIASPINVLDSSPMADGAAAVVLCPREKAPASRRIRILASTLATDTIALHGRRDLLAMEAIRESSRRAYGQAELTPRDIGLFELHDAFTIMSALSLEAAGLAERGQGVRMALDGEIALDGRLPISTMGGLKGRGHPVGASGLYQVVEACLQLRGEAGANQLDVERAMTQSVGGSGATVATHILARNGWRR